MVAAIEKQHEERYRALLNNVEMKQVFENVGIKDPEIVQVAISRLKNNNTFTVEPAPWIITGCREAIGEEE